MKDIERVFDSEEELIAAVYADKAPLRNDIVVKLKDYYDTKGLF